MIVHLSKRTCLGDSVSKTKSMVIFAAVDRPIGHVSTKDEVLGAPPVGKTKSIVISVIVESTHECLIEFVSCRVITA
jgi:hypothetical protein